MKLMPSLLVLVISGIVLPVAVAAQQGAGTGMERGQKARPDPVTTAISSASQKYDAVLGACRFVEIGDAMGSAINSIPAIAPVADYLKFGSNQPLIPQKVTVLEQPRHGTLQLSTDPRAGDTVKNGGPYHYSPDASYFGGKNKFIKGDDQFSFDVEAGGKHFKVVYSVYVIDNVDFVTRYPEVNNLCPNASVSWRISEGDAVTGNESSAMALNDWLMTNQLN
jgi:hypothetical protein